MDVIEILQEYEEYFKQMSIIWLVLYPLIWSLLIDGFYDIAIRMEGMLDSVLSFGGVMESESVQTLYDYLVPLAFIFLTIAIIGIAFQLITGKTVQKTNVLLNIVLAVGVILLLPWVVSQLGELSDDFIEVSQSAGVEDNIEVSSLSTQIVQTNTRDLVYLARNDFTEADNNINNTITDGNIRNIDFAEVIHPNPDDSDNRDYGEDENGESINEHEAFTSKLVDNEDGEETTTEIEPFELSIIGEIPILNEYYYRYTGNFINMFAQLGILIAVMLFTSFKVIRLFFEIAFANIIAPFVATTDLSTGQRTKQLLKDLVINFTVVGLVMLVFKLFMVMMNYLSTLDVNPIVVTVIMFALGLATIDGPDQAKKLLGVDIGVKDGYQNLMSGLALGSAGAKATSGVRSHIGNEKDKLKEQQQERRDQKDTNSEKLAGTGSNSSDSSAYSIDNELNQAMNNDGYMNNAENQGALADAKAEGLSTDSNSGNGIADTDTSNQQALENLVQNADADLDDKERNVLEKVIEDGSASLDSDERKTLNSMMNDDDIGTEEKQALVQTMDSGDSIPDGTSNRDVVENIESAGNNLMEDGEKQVLENLISNDNGNISEDEKQVLENLISNDSGNISDDEKQVMENLKQSDNLGTQEKQAIESIIPAGDSSPVDQDKNVLENLISNDNGSISNDEKQVMENLISNDNGSISQGEKQVLENFISNDSGNISQGERQVMEDVISGDSMDTQSRQMVQTLSNEGTMTAPDIQQNVVRMMNDSAIGSQEADAVVNTLHSPSTASSEQREVVENVITNHPDIGTQDRQVLENVVTQSADIGAQERQVFEKVMEAPQSISQGERQVMENVVSGNNNLTSKERTAVENVVQQHASQNEPQQHTTTQTSGSQVAQTEDIVRNMKTNFRTDTGQMDNIKRRHEAFNRRKDNQ
ncbi:pLS20_p028 family conjugation system transmembrane protein [Salinicoccus albus]|uniref:pLS20_p028 family conjugation system transmembrane protein n=1 Tax=Salinicoccus albus TaxID=418756 RepID=UPI00036D32DE|nr:hypothetical protein [Salinicoccus albus]